MKVYTIQAIKFYNDGDPSSSDVTEQSLHIIQKKRTEFSIWQDPFGDFEGGEDPIHSGLDNCSSLKEVHKLLLAHELIEKNAIFVDIEG
jgi:hypothetical protein